MSPKPAYNALMKLIKGDWWTGPLELRTDEAGKVTFRGYLGNYTIKADTCRANFDLAKPGKDAQSVELVHVMPNKPDAGDSK